MKKFILIIVLFVGSLLHAQNPAVTSTVNVASGLWYDEVPQNSYFKDLFNTFDPFIGTWVYVNGNQKVTFSIKKVTKKYFPDKKIYKDFLVGNYSYSADGGNTYIVNTISQFLNSDPDLNPMYSPGPLGMLVIYDFIDVALDKHRCTAIFEFLQGSITQMKVKISGGKSFRLEGEPPLIEGFTLPQEMIVTKQ